MSCYDDCWRMPLVPYLRASSGTAGTSGPRPSAADLTADFPTARHMSDCVFMPLGVVRRSLTGGRRLLTGGTSL